MPTFTQSTQWFDNRAAFICGWGETTPGTWSDNLQHGRVVINPREVNAFLPISEYELSCKCHKELCVARVQNFILNKA